MGFRDKLEQMKRDKANQKAYLAVAETAEPTDTICATLGEDGMPMYFKMPIEASDDEIQKEAFKLRHGRPMSKAEIMLSDYAARGYGDE